MNIIGTRLQVMRGTAKQTGGGLMKKDLIYNKYNKIVSKKISMKYSKKFGKIMKGGGKRFAIKDFTIESIINNKRSIEINTTYYKPLIKKLEINFDDPEFRIKIYDESDNEIIKTNIFSIDEQITVEYNNMKFIITLQDNDIKKYHDFMKMYNIKLKFKAIHNKVNQSFKNKGYETIYRLSSYKLLNNNSNNTEVESNSNTLYIASIKREEGKIKVHILSIDNTNIKKINNIEEIEIKNIEEIEIDNIEDLLNNLNSNSFKTSLKFKSKNVCQLNFDTKSDQQKFKSFINNIKLFPWEKNL